MCLSDNNEVWSDRLLDQEPKGLSCMGLVDCESDYGITKGNCTP